VLALLYDVHGNLPALEAVLRDAETAGATRFLLGGDYALFGPFPGETIERLRALPDASWIRGNVDRWTAYAEDLPDDELLHQAVADCREAIGAVTAGELGALDEQIVLDGIRFCHASPLNDMESFKPEPADDDARLLAGATEPRVVFGHTHLAFARPGPNDVELVNPGSVGMPFDGDRRAAYALVREDGTIEHRRVEYDPTTTIDALERRSTPWADRSARRLRTARV
jgi:predicted phosphodiesterase